MNHIKNSLCVCMLSCFSRVRLLETLWTVASRLLRPWGFSGKDTGVGCHFLLQRIFPIQGSNPHLLCLLHCRRVLYQLSHRGSPQNLCDELNKYWLGRKDREDPAHFVSESPWSPLLRVLRQGSTPPPASSQLPVGEGGMRGPGLFSQGRRLLGGC